MFKMSALSFHAGMVGERHLGLMSSTTFDGGSLTRFRMKFLPELFENVDLHTRIHIWFTHDSAPPYFLLAFWNS
jgi:hypothetical protein